MEPRFGHSFADVRVHAGPAAARSAAEVGAHAYAVGRDVVFGAGKYAPESGEGRRLIAHELAHVVQQAGAPGAGMRASLAVGPVDAPEEREAERAADLVARGGSAAVGPGGAALLRREDDGRAGPHQAPGPVIGKRPHVPAGPPPAGPQPGAGATPCGDPRLAVVEAARAEAAIRAQVAYTRVAGIGPPPPPGYTDPALEAKQRARILARKMFGGDPDMARVEEGVGHMRSRLLAPGPPVMCTAASDPLCYNKAYVVDFHAPVYLCPSFFTGGGEERVRTLLHESAHLSGIGTSKSESYCAIYACEGSCGGMDTADSWAQFVHCLSGAAPDPATVTP
jgi:hypothetical protein